LALLRLNPGEPARDNLERAVQTIERAADLTRQLLAYTGKGQSKKSPLDLNAIIRENLLLLKSTIPRQVKLITNLADALPHILADSGQIQQVVINLILNAAEAYDIQPGSVAIRTWTAMVESDEEAGSAVPLEPGQYVCLEVKDKGSGMDEETLARIYDPFFTTKFTGRGLGLAAVSGIIRHHQGDIRVESRLGHGTTFKVMLPATEEALAIEKSNLLSSPVKNGCVMVIDDELSIRIAIADFLGYFGQRIITAEDGRAGLALFKKHVDDIDLVILDLTMPLMSGRETLIELHKIRPELPVILLSGFSEEEALEQIGDSNNVDFLQKPFRLPALVKKLNEMMR
jgi:CheY-like chemotaxis protein